MKHGHTSPVHGPGRTTPEYRSWRAMKDRCLRYSEDHASYFGLPIHQPWVDSFEAFLADLGPRPSLKHTLDRIDGALGYAPGNCRWATKAEQARNRSTSIFPGRSVEQAADAAGLNVETVRSRLSRGYSPEQAITPKGEIIRCGHNGDSGRGEKNIHAKLTAEKVASILRRSDERSIALAEQFGVTRTTINLIRARKVWSHVHV